MVMLRIVPMSLSLSKTSALDAKAVPAVMPSMVSSSASLITADPIVIPPTVATPVIPAVPATVNAPAKANVELDTVACGVNVRWVTKVPAEAISFPSVIVPPSATSNFHSSPASSPSSARSVTARPAPSAAEIASESVVVSS